jgi:hypothetical protein
MRINIFVLAGCVLLSIAVISSGDSRKSRRHSSNNSERSDDQQLLERDRVSAIFESYDKSMSDKQVTERLDALGLQLEAAPTFRAYIVSYGGRRSCPGEALRRAQLAKDYLLRLKGISRQRIRTMDGGFKEEWTVELWTTAEGALPPTPMPTIERRDVRALRNCNPRSSKDKRHSS